ncbi:MAG: glutathione-dependent reductase [Rhodospirillaceae bacterium]|nr:MAG: glutathione-dependent reductase [Rhodospirillaceae bacterium]
MGLLQDGVWVDQWYDTKSNDGKFVRKDATYRNCITKDGDFKPESGRYHLYVSHACPWAHRTMIFRVLKGLEEHISVSVVDWFMGGQGWTFTDPEPVNGASMLHQIYTAADENFSGRVTVPVLWDKQTQTIVCNESSEIIRMFNSAFDDVGAAPGDYYPQALRAEIDEVNARIYDTLNNGVYKVGFATTQQAYEEALVPLFETLDWVEDRLSRHRYLCGNQLTEADWRLFTTLVRFDPVYVGHFKCNLKRIADYEHLQGFVQDLYQREGIADTVHMDHIKNHYYGSHATINPSGVVPIGPILMYDAPHNRSKL